MQPIRDQILVRPMEGDSVSEGGIIVPDSCKKPSNKVEIVAVGNGTKKNPMLLKKGDVGYRVKDWGLEIIIEGVQHFMMDQKSIIALN